MLSLTPHASFMQSIDWLNVRWDHGTEKEDHFVIGVKDGEKIVGFVPLVIARVKTSLGEMKVAKFPLDGWGSFFGPVSSHPNETLSLAIDYLFASKRKFDFLELTAIPDLKTTLPSVEVDQEVTSIQLINKQCQEDSRVGQIDLTDDWDTYWESRRKQKNRRRNVERCARRLNELGDVRWERFRPEVSDPSTQCDLRWEVFEACERISSISWQKDLTNGNTLHHEDVNPLLRDAYQAGVRAGSIDVSLLYLDDQAIAYAFGYHYKGYVDLYRIGFDPQYAKFAPGNALWSRLIRDSFERGDRVLDLGPTCLDYKRFWVTRLEPSYTYCRYSSIKSKALRAARQVKGLRNPGVPIVDTNLGNRQSAMEGQL